MRSRLEADFARMLDNEGLEWEYEPQCFADETGQYLPDFLVIDQDGEATYIECKGEMVLEDRRTLDDILRRMRRIYASEPDVFLALYVLSWDSEYHTSVSFGQCAKNGREWYMADRYRRAFTGMTYREAEVESRKGTRHG